MSTLTAPQETGETPRPPRREIRDVPPTRPPGYLAEFIRDLKAFHARVLAERGGVPFEGVDDILDEMKGRRDPGCS